MSDYLLLNSGGIDSRVTACILKNEGHRVHSFHVHFNTHSDSAVLPAAARTAELYCVDHFIFEYPVNWTVLKSQGLYEIPYPPLSALVLGAQMARGKGWLLASGIKAEGRRQKNFLELFHEILRQSLRDPDIEIYAPVYEKKFEEVVALAKALYVPLEDTYSCPNFPPCGACYTCTKRKAVNL